MARYRKKPIVVEAIQFFENNPNGLPFAEQAACQLGPVGWCVTTIHGHHTPIEDGDWIIREYDNKHFYPCKPDIFDATYEPV